MYIPCSISAVYTRFIPSIYQIKSASGPESMHYSPQLTLPAELARRRIPFIECTQIYLPVFLVASTADPVLVPANDGSGRSFPGGGPRGGARTARRYSRRLGIQVFTRGGLGQGKLDAPRVFCPLASTTASPHSMPSAASATLRRKRTRTHLQDVPHESHV